MKIYFDGTLVDADYYIELRKNVKMFDKSFKMGASACRNYVIKVNRDAITGPINVITIYQTENNQDILKDTLRVTKIEDTDNYTSTIFAEDNMTLFNVKYDVASRFPNQTTYNSGDIFDDILTFVGVSLMSGLSVDVRRDITIGNPGRTLMARDYLSMLGEVSMLSYFINESGELALRGLKKSYDSSPSEIATDYSEYKIGTKHKISRVMFDGDNAWVYGDTTEETYYLNPDNIFILQASDVQSIYNNIKDKEYYDVKIKDVELIKDLFIGKMYKIVVDNVDYPFIYQYEDAIYYQNGDIGKWIGTVNIQVENEAQKETEVIGVPNELREIRRTVDYDSGRIDQVIIEKVGNSEVISKINQSAEAVEISANKINLNGAVTANNNFKILSDGSMEAVNGKFSGKIDLVSSETNNKMTINGIFDNINYTANYWGSGFNIKDPTGNYYVHLAPEHDYGNVDDRFGISFREKTGNYNLEINPKMIAMYKNYISPLSGTLITQKGITTGNIDWGTGSCSSSGVTHISFNKTFPDVPCVIATPNTTTGGVITLKTSSITTTGFDITIGGTSFPTPEQFCWIAISDFSQ